MSAYKRRAPLDDDEDEAAVSALAEEDEVAQEIRKVVDLEVEPVTKPVRPFIRVRPFIHHHLRLIPLSCHHHHRIDLHMTS
jgi:hypothetical protein